MSLIFTSGLPMLILAAGAILVFIAGALAPSAGRIFRTIALVAALAATLAGIFTVPAGGQSLFDTSPYARFFVTLLCALTFLSLLFGGEYARLRGFERDEFHALMLLSGLGMCLLAVSVNWIMAAIGLESISLPLYVLIAARRDSALSLEAAVKYFVLGAVASVMFFFGAALLYAASGSLDIVRSLAQGNPGITLLGLGFILAGLAFKLSLAPVHLWTPDVLQGAPAPVAAFLSGGSKVAVFAALLRMAASASPAWNSLTPALWILAALSMTGGTLGALTQSRVKRMLAYASVAHMGYLMLALLAAKQTGPGPAMFAAAAFGIMDVAVFGSLGLLSPVRWDADLIDAVRGIGLRYPVRAAALAVSLLTLGGLPPTVGFMSKLVVFRAALSAGYLWLSVIGVIWAIAGMFYVLRALAAMYAPGPRTDTAQNASLPAPGFTGWLALALAILLLIGLGALPAPVLDAAAPFTHLP